MFKRIALIGLAILTVPVQAASAPVEYLLVSENHIRFDQFGAFFDKKNDALADYKLQAKPSIYSFYGNRVWFSLKTDSIETVASLQDSSAHSGVFGDRLRDVSTSRNIFVLKYRPELSYLPENPRITDKETRYVRRIRFHIKPNKVEDALSVMAEFKGLFEKHRIQSVVKVYTGLIDDDLPYIDIFRFGKSAEDYHQYEDFVNRTFGYETLSKVMKPFALALSGEEVDEGKVISL